MTVDIIILSHGKTQPLIELTQRTIDSCIASEKEIQFNIVVIEQEPNVIYANCKTHHITEPFNYNRFMNIGIEMTENEFVCLCNNDLIFSEGWCLKITTAMVQHGLLSACPSCPDATKKNANEVDFGYNNRHHMSGWCIMTRRDLYKTIGKISEDFPFWFADNEYAEQLKDFNVKHALIRNSVVKHLGSSTLNTLEKELHDEYTRGYIKKFYTKRPRNESAVFFKSKVENK